MVIWQDASDEYGVGEPALLLEGYSDTITITQGDQSVIINYETIKELVKAMKVLQQEKK